MKACWVRALLLQNPYIINGEQCLPPFTDSPFFYKKILISPFYDFSKIQTPGVTLCNVLIFENEKRTV